MNQNNLLILNFHSVFRPETKDVNHYDPVFSVSEEQFENYLKIIQDKAVNTCSWSDIREGKTGFKNQVALSFDDGHLSDYELVIPLLKKYNMDACFFIVAENIQNDQLAWDRVKEIHQMGFSIGSHGLRHKKMTLLNEMEQEEEFLKSKQIIERCIGSEIHFFAFPEGRYSTHLVETGKKAGYKKLFSTEAKWNQLKTSCDVIGRWSIKQNGLLTFFEKILSRKFLGITYLKALSGVKFHTLKMMDYLLKS